MKKTVLVCLVLCLALSCLSLTSFAQPVLDALNTGAAQVPGMTVHGDDARETVAVANSGNQTGVISTYSYRMGAGSGISLMAILLQIAGVLWVGLFVFTSIKIIQACNLYLKEHKGNGDFKR